MERGYWIMFIVIALVVGIVIGGGIGSKDIRDLGGVLTREKAELGVFITLQESTKPMRTEAAAAGFYHNDFWQKDFPRVQIFTIEELLAGQQPD